MEEEGAGDAAATHSAEEQKDIYKKLQGHFHVILHGPCKLFPGYPFTCKGWAREISITAIIEHFGKKQRDALIASCNRMLERQGGHLNTGVSSIVSSLRASDLRRAEGGIQFEADPSTSFTQWAPERLMEELRTCRCAGLWTHVPAYSDFVGQCQIRYNITPFGESDVKEVRFIPYPGVPIFLMLWLLRQLDFKEPREECGFGHVVIVGVSGLPDWEEEEEQHCLHFSSGVIKWD
jgi:hypothetical protein